MSLIYEMSLTALVPFCELAFFFLEIRIGRLAQ